MAGLDWLGPLLAPKGKRDESVARASLTPGGVGEALAPAAGGGYEAELAATRAAVLADQSKPDTQLGITSTAAADAALEKMKADAAAANKERDRLAEQQRMRLEADKGKVQATPKGQAENQKAPAPTAKPPEAPVGTGVGVTGQKKSNPEQSFYGTGNGDRGRYAAMKLPNGRMVYGDVNSIKSRVDRGEGTWGEKPGGVGVGDPQSRIGGGEGGAAVLGPSNGFMAGRGLDRALDAAASSGRPFSEALRAEPMQSDLSKEGTNWTFSGGLGTGAPREGMRMLSGAENAQEERAWRERRIREEQGREIGDIQVEAAKAKALYQLRMAEMDPMALAQIQARGRYGAEEIRSRSEALAREAAFNEFSKAMEVAMSLPLGAERDQMIQFARDRASILLGNQYGFGRAQDPMAMALAGMMGVGGAGAATGGTQK